MNLKIKLSPDVYVQAAEFVDSVDVAFCCNVLKQEAKDSNGYDYVAFFTQMFKPLTIEECRTAYRVCGFSEETTNVLAHGALLSSAWMSTGGLNCKQDRVIALLLCAELVRSYHGKPITIHDPP